MLSINTQQVLSFEAAVTVFLVGAPQDIEARVKINGIDCSVEDRWIGNLASIPALLCESAADPMCRTFSGVVAALSSEVGRNVGPGEMVTGLVLRRVENPVIAAMRMPPWKKRNDS